MKRQCLFIAFAGAAAVAFADADLEKEFDENLFVPGTKEGLNIELDKAIHVRDLVLPEGVTAATDESLIVCHVRAPKAEEAEETAEAPAVGAEDAAAAAPAEK